MDDTAQSQRNERALGNIFRTLNNWLRPRRRYQPSRTYMRGAGPACEQDTKNNNGEQVTS